MTLITNDDADLDADADADADTDDLKPSLNFYSNLKKMCIEEDASASRVVQLLIAIVSFPVTLLPTTTEMAKLCCNAKKIMPNYFTESQIFLQNRSKKMHLTRKMKQENSALTMSLEYFDLI